MSHRINKIRKRIAKRQRYQNRRKERPDVMPHSYQFPYDENEPHLDARPPVHPLWNRETFLLKILCAAALVLGVGVMFKSPSPIFEQPREFALQTMEKEFQFAAVSDWYESQFGKPLVLFPQQKEEPQTENVHAGDFALPVGAKISADFSEDGRGVMIESGASTEVEAMGDGVVVFSGKKDDIGQTVIIQHTDGAETWYGKLEGTKVKPLARVKAGQTIGRTAVAEDRENGAYYFAYKKGDAFLDPLQVIDIE